MLYEISNQREIPYSISLEENSSIIKWKNQILVLFLTITNTNDELSRNEITRFLFENIFQVLSKLMRLHLFQLSNTDLSHLSFGDQFPMFSSSILVQLNINLDNLSDCLYFLDGRLHQLRSFYVNIRNISKVSSNINVKVNN